MGERKARKDARVMAEEKGVAYHAYSCAYCCEFHVGADDERDVDEKEKMEKIPEPSPIRNISYWRMLKIAQELRGIDPRSDLPKPPGEEYASTDYSQRFDECLDLEEAS